MKSRELINSLNNAVTSSYSKNDLGLVIYDYVIKRKPKRVVELGTLHGYSAICMGLALRDNGFGKFTCYDLWDNYEFIHTSMTSTADTIRRYGLDDIITLKTGNALKWCKNPDSFDLLHVDISNDGEKIRKIYDLLSGQVKEGSEILFEGGTKERDETSWIKTYGFMPIESVKEETGYCVIDDRWPGLSLISERSNQ